MKIITVIVTLCCAFILSAGQVSADTVTFFEDFSSDAFIAGNGWEVEPYNMSYPSGWIHSYSGGDLYTQDIVGVQDDDWIKLAFTKHLDHKVTGDFSSTLNMSWDSVGGTNLNQSIMTVSLSLYTAEDLRVGHATYYDIYGDSAGKLVARSYGDVAVETAQGSLDYSGSMSISIEREDGVVASSATHGTLSASSTVTGNELEVDYIVVLIRGFIDSAWNPYFGTAVFHDLSFSGEYTPVPEPLTIILLLSGIVRLGLRRK